MESRLPTKLAAYQNQCFGKDGKYTGFRCPNTYSRCPIKEADGKEIIDALDQIGGLIELDHHDDSRFSSTKTTLPHQVTAMCTECHTLRHALENDASANRLSKKQ